MNLKTEEYMTGGLRWHLLSCLTEDKEGPVEILAATCVDGIGVFVRWVKEDGEWTAEEMSTEGEGWNLVEHDEDSEIPRIPPSVWDDISTQNLPTS